MTIVFVDVVACMVSFAKNAEGEDDDMVFFVEATMRSSLVAENPRKLAARTGTTIQFAGWDCSDALPAS